MADKTTPSEEKSPPAKAWKATGTYRSPGSGNVPVSAVRNGVVLLENGASAKDDSGKEIPAFDLTREGASEPFCTGCAAKPSQEEGYYTPDA